MPYRVESIANALINRAAVDGQKIEHLKLQKLLYYANGYYLAAQSAPLIDHTFEAWDYGPVVPALYRELRRFRAKPITDPLGDTDWDSGGKIPIPTPVNAPVVDKVIDFTWRTYGKYDGWQLSEMTHRPDSPWDQTRKANPGIKDADIPRDLLEKHFKALIKKPANA